MRDYKFTEDPELEAYILEAMGEMAVSKLFGLILVNDPTVIDRGYDLFLPSGRKAAVQTRTQRGDRFEIEIDHRHYQGNWDIGILVWLNLDLPSNMSAEFAKFITHTEFIHRSKPEVIPGTDLRKCYSVSLEDMEDIDVLCAYEQRFMRDNLE